MLRLAIKPTIAQLDYFIDYLRDKQKEGHFKGFDFSMNASENEKLKSITLRQYKYFMFLIYDRKYIKLNTILRDYFPIKYEYDKQYDKQADTK